MINGFCVKKGKSMSIIKKGDKFNFLTAIRFDHRDKQSRQHWLFKCDCGIEKVICVSNVKSGGTISCSCLNGKTITHGMEGTKTYKSWGAMKSRCLNKNNEHYKYYGGRGIIVCPKWLDFENFYKDMGEKPENKTLDRIDNNKNYCKSNCKWSTREEQMNNTRYNRLLTYKNKTQTIAQWARELSINYGTIYSRLKRGWSVNKALERRWDR